MNVLDCGENTNYFWLFIKSIIISVLCSLFFILILSILLSTTDLKENIINPTVIFISSISTSIGGFLISKKIKKKGIIYGAILGIIYMLIMYIFSSITNMNFSLNLNAIIMIGFGILGGALGGILGVNL